VDFGWLQGRYTFSFGDYYDPRHMGFRSLRVINEDRIAPGGGFPTHPHRDMEIFSYVVSGRLAHGDSLGNRRELKPGDIQLMSAGRGVRHSEFNPSQDETTHMLQIWIQPRATGLPPAYTDWEPAPRSAMRPLSLIISADGRDGSAKIHQDAEILRLNLKAGSEAEYHLRDGRGLWLQVVRGSLGFHGVEMKAGDGASLEGGSGLVALSASEDAEALLFDLA